MPKKKGPSDHIARINQTGCKFICWETEKKTAHSKVYVECKAGLHVNLVKVTNIIHANQGSCLVCGRNELMWAKRKKRELVTSERLAKKGLQLLSFTHDDEKHNNSELSIQCANGHVYTTSLSSTSLNGCPRCAGNQKYGEKVDEILSALRSRGIVVISKLNAKLRAGTKLDLLFPCGHVGKRNVYDSLNLKMKPQCAACTHRNLPGKYSPNNITGSGRENSPVHLYVLELEDDTRKFWKVGISTNVHRRIQTIKRPKIQVINIKHAELPLLEAIEIEQEVLGLLAEEYYLSPHMRGGKHECVLVDPTDLVLEKLSQKGIYQWQK